MKKLTLIFLLFSTQIFAQKADKKLNKLIQEKEVSRIIKTLSADEMMGRDSKKPDEIAKASTFIENEFGKIGLQKFNSAVNYKQSFDVRKIEKNSVEIVLNGNKVDESNVITFSEANSINISNIKNVLVLDKEMKFWENFQKWNRDSTDKIIFVNSFHAKSFNQALGYYGGPRIVTKFNPKLGSKVYILTDEGASQIVVLAKIS